MFPRTPTRLRAATALAAAGLALTTLAACGSSKPDAGPAKDVDAADLKGTVTVWSWDVAATALKRLGEEFHALEQALTRCLVEDQLFCCHKLS